MTRKIVNRKGKARDSYLELILRFPLRPIRSDQELDQAICVIDDLVDRPRLNSGQRDYLDVLSDLVEKYEEENHPIPPASDAEMLRFLLDLRDLSQVGLARETGITESTISAVLTGKRQLTRRQIGLLASFFQIEPDLFSFRA
ncbi:MAG: helix-turn-helix domain-containing protein [Gemmataceae bacterium]|nr:helix-turn-helix domain-containing protein [Gemmataceae bacterium]MCI0742989.1 helix-turn-helix domain-containing protein [Gemmataceae bacterium]